MKCSPFIYDMDSKLERDLCIQRYFQRPLSLAFQNHRNYASNILKIVARSGQCILNLKDSVNLKYVITFFFC